LKEHVIVVMRTANDVQESTAGKEDKVLEGAYPGGQESLQILAPDSDLSFILLDATIGPKYRSCGALRAVKSL
jgi:hypothetical protein